MVTGATPDASVKPDTPTYPPLPGIFNVPWSLDEVWAKAWIHKVLIRAYLLGIDGYIHPRELTAGAGRPCPALAWWGEPEPPVRPCSCRYFHQRTRMVIHEGRSPQSIFLVVGTGFAIDRDCLHHGDTALIHPIGEPVDPRFWETLDELERGH